MSHASATGVGLALLSNRLEGIARKMGNTLLRTGRSGVLNRAKDFSCCIALASGELLVTAESLPAHVLGGIDLMCQSMLDFHPHMKRGDAYLHNSPYHGCTHPADHTILVPVVDDDGVHRFTLVAKAHQADIGNSVPTTYFGDAKDVYHEGALIFPAVQVQRDYRNIDDIIRMCRLRIRVPEQWYGDYLAMLGAARVGEREILALGKEVGWDALARFSADWFDYSEQRMATALSKLPAGVVTAQSTHDAFPGTPQDGVPVNVKVETLPNEGRIVIDLRDNMDNLPCGLNMTEATVISSAMTGLFNSIDGTVPKNAGSARRVSILMRDGAAVGRPRHPTSCSVATSNLADRVANATQRAIAELADGHGMAEAGTIIPPADGVISGIDARTGKPFVNQIFLGISGGAATPLHDGWLTLAHVGNAGMSHQDSIEMAEVYQPLLVRKKYLVADSEGAGRRRGAPSCYVEFEPTHESFTIAYVCDGMINAARGARGGGIGGPAIAQKRLADGRVMNLPGCAQVEVKPGEAILSTSCGGGGYGDPTARPIDMVREDVLEGFVTITRAREVYRVAISRDGTVDEGETRRLRMR